MVVGVRTESQHEYSRFFVSKVAHHFREPEAHSLVSVRALSVRLFIFFFFSCISCVCVCVMLEYVLVSLSLSLSLSLFLLVSLCVCVCVLSLSFLPHQAHLLGALLSGNRHCSS